MSELPEKRLLRRGEVRDYYGISDNVFSQMVASGVLTPIYLAQTKGGKPKGRAFFSRKEVLAVEQKQPRN